MKTKFLAAIVAFVFISCGGSSSDSYYSSSESSGGTSGSNISFTGSEENKYRSTGQMVDLYSWDKILQYPNIWGYQIR